MKKTILMLAAVLMFTSTPTFAATFANISNVDVPQLVALDDHDDDRYDHDRYDDDRYDHDRHDHDDDDD